MNVHFRSNDAYKAGFMNMYAFIELQAYIADRIGVPVGEYVHIADSYHIYGSYFDEFKGFLNVVDKRDPEDRVYESEWAYDYFLEGCATLLAEEDLPPAMKEKVLERKKDIDAKIAETKTV
jgi:thymidylate synthase